MFIALRLFIAFTLLISFVHATIGTDDNDVTYVEAFGGRVPVKSFAWTLMTSPPDQHHGLFQSLASKSEEADKIFQTFAFITEIAKGALGLDTQKSVDEKTIHKIILCLSEDTKAWWRKNIFHTPGLDAMNGVKFMSMMGQAELSDAAKNIKEIRGLSTDSEQASILHFPKGYSDVLQKFIADQRGNKFIITWQIEALKTELSQASSEQKKQTLVGRLAFLGLRLHAATHPNDFYFDTLPANLLIPILSGDPIEGAIVLDLLLNRVKFELNILDHKFGQRDPQIAQDVRLKNFLALSCDIKVAAWSALSENNFATYNSILNDYIKGLSQTHRTTWGGFKAYFNEFYEHYGHDKKRFAISERAFLEHDDIQEDAPLFVNDAPDTQKARINETLQDLKEALADLEQNPHQSEDDIQDITFLSQAQALLTAAHKAIENHNMKQFNELWTHYEYVRSQIHGDACDENTPQTLDEEQDALIAELQQEGGVSDKRKKEILDRARIIQDRLENAHS